ncbi:MAG TPA: alpha-glucan family phosphorylase [Rhodopila sp.]|nr:alpha-glucan family phosphorylase [Rhodopila sp.]
MRELLKDFISRIHIAYFSMEIAMRPEMQTYSGGLGILAGDTVRSCSDLDIPVVFVTLISRAGYFRQQLDPENGQVEQPDLWDPSVYCVPLDAMIALRIEQRPVWIRPWLYIHTSPRGHRTPVLLLDSDLDQNDAADRELTHYLYGGGESYRLKQELILGLGGIRLLQALGFDLHTYHLNEGHAAFLTLDLLNRYRFPPEDVRPGEPIYDLAEVRERCVFTTHTPVEAGHDRFSYDLFEKLVPELVDLGELKQLAGANSLNMTQLALSLAGYTNGVARRHAETTRQMFPGYRVHAITNGIHVGLWAHPAFAQLFCAHWPHWLHEPDVLVRALQLSDQEVMECHRVAKAGFIDMVNTLTGVSLDPNIATLGFARRMTGYKRPLLLFSDVERLIAIASRQPVQIVLAGKAHPRDEEGKHAILRLVKLTQELRGRVTCAFLPNYDMRLAQAMVSGVDVWVNTPLPPMEASGTSGMKAALNGVLNLSVLDGWWIEACIEGVTGWAIGEENDPGSAETHAAVLYQKLDRIVLPLFYTEQGRWCMMMKQSIANIASYFNSQRMMRRYASEAYLR